MDIRRYFLLLILNLDFALSDDEFLCQPTYQKCHIVCNEGHIGDVISEAKYFVRKCSSIHLTLINIEFENKTLSPGWLDFPTSISELVIRDSNLEIIEPGAFNADCFNKTEILSITNGQLKYLPYGILNGLNNLEELFILQVESVNYLENIFSDNDVKRQMKKIYVQCGFNLPGNLTYGDGSFVSLTELILRKNHFGNRMIKTDFLGFEELKMLDLSDNEITALPIGIFDDIGDTLDILNLANNLLKTINPKIFNPFLGGVYTTKINLHYNHWECTCELQPLIDFLVQTTSKEYLHFLTDGLTCFSAKGYINIPIEKWQLCENPTTFRNHDIQNTDNMNDQSQETTAVSLPKNACDSDEMKINEKNLSKIENNSKNMRIICKQCDMLDCSDKKNMNYLEILVRSRNEDIEIKTTSKTSINVTVMADHTKYSIIWFSKTTKETLRMAINYNEYGLGCIKNGRHTINIQNLQPNETYTICLIENNSVDVSPFNCFPYHVEAEENQQSDGWVSKDMKITTISLLLIGILFAGLLGAALLYCIVRNNPSLLKGNKRVVVVNKGFTDVLILPRNSSICSNDLKGISNCGLANRDRRHSNESIISNISYVSPNIYEIIQGQKAAPNCYTTELPIRHNITDVPPVVPKRLSTDPLPIPPIVADEIPYTEYEIFHSTV